MNTNFKTFAFAFLWFLATFIIPSCCFFLQGATANDIFFGIVWIIFGGWVGGASLELWDLPSFKSK